MERSLNTMPLPKPDDKILRKIEKSNEELAREIALSGNFDKIEKDLQEKKLLDSQIERVKKKFENQIDKKDFPTKSEELWRMLTIIELFDTGTAKHCVETYIIFKEKINKKLTQGIILRSVIKEEVYKEKEQISQSNKNFNLDVLLMERVYLACILHDIGKVEIPKFILNNQTKKEEWDEILEKMIDGKSLPQWSLEKLGFGKNENPIKEKIFERMKEKNIFAKQLIPVKKVLSQEDCEKLRTLGFDPDSHSLMSIIGTHEEKSKNILLSRKFPIASEIAGQHHTLKKDGSFPVSVGVLQMSNITSKIVTDFLHLSDVENAMSGDKRPYQKEGEITPIRIVYQQYKEFMAGEINTITIYLWIKDVFQEASEESLSQEEQFWQKEIKSFLESLEKEGDIEKIFREWIKQEKEISLAA